MYPVDSVIHPFKQLGQQGFTKLVVIFDMGNKQKAVSFTVDQCTIKRRYRPRVLRSGIIKRKMRNAFL